MVASGPTEHDVYHRLFGRARECLHDMIVTGQPLPVARGLEELPQEPTIYRRLLFIIS